MTMRVTGQVTVPGDKSISHRALMFAALAQPGAASVVREILDSADVRSTAAVLRALGVPIPVFSPAMTIPGVGRRGLAAASVALDCGSPIITLFAAWPLGSLTRTIDAPCRIVATIAAMLAVSRASTGAVMPP